MRVVLQLSACGVVLVSGGGVLQLPAVRIVVCGVCVMWVLSRFPAHIVLQFPAVWVLQLPASCPHDQLPAREVVWFPEQLPAQEFVLLSVNLYRSPSR